MSKFNYVKDPEIKKVLEEYKHFIDSYKPHRLDVSSYTVDKPWGHELWLELNQYYTFKLIHMKKGYKSSLQRHEKKFETNYVIEGEAEVLLETPKGTMESRTFKSGQGWTVPTKTKHRVIALTDYTALECSTSHLDDCTRYEDDSGRGSGKIKSEHKVKKT